MPTKVRLTWDEMVAYSETEEAKANLEATLARLKTLPRPEAEDPENPWLTEADFARAITRVQGQPQWQGNN